MKPGHSAGLRAVGRKIQFPSPRPEVCSVAALMPDTPKTWHYGLVARWWAEFNEDGPEIAYFQKYVERGQPALDVACGTGRLLIPYLRAGLDVDGCDVSRDMIALCREKAEREGLSPTLFVQAMHELKPPAEVQHNFRLRRVRARKRPGTRHRGAAPLLRKP
jgi:SAM-dependent methyltransferase